MTAFRSRAALALSVLLLLAAACSQKQSQPDTGGVDSAAAPAASARVLEDAASPGNVTAPAQAPVSSAPIAPPAGQASTPQPTPESNAPAGSVEAPPLQEPTTRPPRLDRAIAGVPLDLIIFDTFSVGLQLPLTEASDNAIEGLRDAIRPIYVPRYEAVEGGNWLREDDLVVGYAGETAAYAYPVKILNVHELVNDVIDGIPVLVSYCPLCSSGMVHSRVLDGRVLLFGNTSALYESDLVMYDHETGSFWQQVLGEAIAGTLTGRRLELLPSQTTTWGQWRRLYPGTRVLSIDQGIFNFAGNPYQVDRFRGYARRVDSGQFAFPVSQEKLDRRLPFSQVVLAVRLDGQHKAYPLAREGGDWLANDEVAGVGVVVVGRSAGPSGVAYLSTLDGRALTFRLEGGLIVDNETGSTWDDAGRAITGSLAGAVLTPVPSLSSFWFSISTAVPGIKVYVAP